MIFTARQIAGILNGTVEGNPDALVSTVSKIEEGVSGSLSFLANPKYTEYIYTTKASAVIVGKDFKPLQHLNTTLIRVDDAYQSFAKLLEYYNKLNKNKQGREEPNNVSPSAKIGSDVYIGAFVYIGENAEIANSVKLYPGTYIGDNVKVGANSTLFQGVKVYHGCVIGNDCTVHAGVVIGGDGFGFAPNAENNYAKVPQIGNVVIEDRVEIGANTTIDRATLGSTIIRKGVKLDNLIQIAHNVEIGENTVIAAQTGIAGSTKIGKNCMIGGQVGIIGHLSIGDSVMIAAQSGIGGNLKDGEIVQGSPAFGVGEYKRSYVVFRKLPELNAKIAELEKKLNETIDRRP
ncbi:MAG: UDP-3-O-(3-hydroxymyristoyl)glucosamine N-acyltransferase [Bacteroidia bacterium]|nr:UDP-3-O-(3-hydroxymyristoyl)glucosamine N-acyltransferase [Bacteroidia bacterium]